MNRLIKATRHCASGSLRGWRRPPLLLASIALIAGLVLLCGGIYAAAGDTDPQPGSLHLTHAQIQEQQSVGFTSAPYTITPADTAGPWSGIALPYAPPPRRWPIRQHLDQDAQPTVITWYRLQTDGLAQVHAPRYIYIPRWKADGRIAVYGDARRLYQSHSNLLSIPSNHALWIALDNGGSTPLPRIILIRIQHFRGTDPGLSSVWVGTDMALGWKYQFREWLQAQAPLMSSSALLAIGVFSFFIWLRRRRETIYLLYGLVSVASFIRTSYEYIGSDWVPISDAWFGWLIVNTRFWNIVLAHRALAILNSRSQPWLTYLVVFAATASSLLTLPLLHSLPQAAVIAPLMFAVLLLLATAVFTTGAWHAWLSRSRDGFLMASWGLVAIALGLHDWLLENNLINIEGMFLGFFINFSACFVFMYVMFQRYMGALDEVALINSGLEKRLRTREAELAESYQRLREVEQQQILNEERQRITQDMHDGLGASLISALRSVERGRLSQAGMAEMLKGCVDDLMLSIDSLDSVEADLLLLLATLRFRIGPRLKSMGIELRWEIQDVPALDWLDPTSSLYILRILQEAFTNIIKHTTSSEIRVATTAEENGVTVSVVDNGQGFVHEQAMKNGGRGLLNQMRRAEAIKGTVKWRSNDRGTHFLLWLPEKRPPAG